MSETEFSPTKAPWRLRYNHQGSGQFVVESDEGMIAEICSQPNQISDANAHLISAAPKLYQALKEFLLSSEEACLLYTSPSPRDRTRSRMPSSA